MARRAKDTGTELRFKLVIRLNESPNLFKDLERIPTGPGRRIRLISLISIGLTVDQGATRLSIAAPPTVSNQSALPSSTESGIERLTDVDVASIFDS
jgi:hypothetical protein